ncbi:MAG: hypothetical protein Q9162_002867 [Coniocarpon cinnabarinum]
MEEHERQQGSISYDAPPSDSESGDDDRLLSDSARYDHEWLDGQQEEEELLAKSRQPLQRISQNQSEPQRQLEIPRYHEEKGTGSPRRRHGRRELIHKIEEGGSRGESPMSEASEGSSERDREKMGTILAHKKTSRTRRICGLTLIHVIIAALFVIIAYGAYHASQATRKEPNRETMVSNGTSLFAPTTLFISLDGFRADYISRGLSPTLASFVKQGVSPKYMTPSFPSLTFPNHYTMVTGLYPESHGIVANTFWDDRFREEFVYTNKAHSMQSKWWNQNPLWETAERQGVPAAIHMWPGSEAHVGDMEPSYVDKYNGSEVLSRKVDRILGLLDQPGPMDHDASLEQPRPQLIAAYVPNVDAQGHKFGPNSTQVNATIVQVDDMLQSLLTGLDARNLTNIVNIVIVSDHGMATTDSSRLVQFEDVIDPNLIEHIDGWPHYGLRPKNMNDVPTIHHKLVEESKTRDGFDVFLREEMPARFHFQNNDRIAPVWLIAHTGWAIVTKDEYNVEEGQSRGDVYHPRGIHGYDHEDPLMRAIFVARGPAFPHQPGSKVKPFQNIEVYNIVCGSLGLQPHANNGTLRLPFETQGLHADAFDGDDEVDETNPADAKEMNTNDEGPGAGKSDTQKMTGHELDTNLEDEPAEAEGRPDGKEMARKYWQWVGADLDYHFACTLWLTHHRSRGQ